MFQQEGVEEQCIKDIIEQGATARGERDESARCTAFTQDSKPAQPNGTENSILEYLLL